MRIRCACAPVSRARYFRAYLPEENSPAIPADRRGASAPEDVDISVHCDVHIFEWLVKYIEAPLAPPRLDAASVVSILISSDFLEMERLVAQCLRFMAVRLPEIVRMPIDLGCISDRLLGRLADLLDAQSLAGLKDKRDKLLPKLYKRRLELDFRNPPLDAKRGAGLSKLCACRWCGRLFHFGAVGLLSCDRAPLAVGFRGEVRTTPCTPSDLSFASSPL